MLMPKNIVPAEAMTFDYYFILYATATSTISLVLDFVPLVKLFLGRIDFGEFKHTVKADEEDAALLEAEEGRASKVRRPSLQTKLSISYGSID